jgi:hypothetical protein
VPRAAHHAHRAGRACNRPSRPRRRVRTACRIEGLEPRTLLAVAPVAPAGTEFRVNTTTLHSQADPAVAMDAAGDSVVAWVTSDGTGIYAQRYDAAGRPLGGEFRPATAGAIPAVAAEKLPLEMRQ